APEQLAPGREDPRGQLRRMAEGLRPRPDAEIGGFQLQRYRAAGERIALEAGGDFFAQVPQPQFQPPEIGDVLIEGSFRRDALGLAVGVDLAIVDTVRQARESWALAAVAAHQFALAGALQIADRAQAVAREALLRHL